MKIGINATSAITGGGVTYLTQLITNLAKIDSNNQYVIFTADNPEHEFNRINQSNFSYYTKKYLRFSIVRIFWEQFFLPVIVTKKKINILYNPANIAPLLTGNKNAIMMQSIAPYFLYTQNKQPIIQKIRLHFIKTISLLTIKKAKKIIFLSEFTKNYFIKNYNFNNSKAKVIYLGRNSKFHSNLDVKTKTTVQKKYSLPDNYILSVNTNINEYKKINELILAYNTLPNNIKEQHKLLIIGSRSDKKYFEKIITTVTQYNLKDNIIFIDKINYQDIPFIYSSAQILVQTSICENFSHILIEAMSVGTPIVSSDETSMPEACQEAAIFYNCYDYKDLGQKIHSLLISPEKQQELKLRGLERAKEFSWRETAEQTLSFLTKINE